MKAHLLILISLFISICSQSCGQNNIKNEEQSFNEIKQFFPNEFTNHFPDMNKRELLILDTRFPAGCYAENWCGVHLIIKLSNEEIDKYEEFCKKNCLAIYHFNDSCLEIINFNSKDYKSNLIKLSLCDSLDRKLLPVSNFNFFFKAFPNFSIQDEASIYVLKAEKGHFIEKENLSKKGVGLSSDWKNGYSKGIVICRKQNIAFFWLEVW